MGGTICPRCQRLRRCPAKDEVSIPMALQAVCPPLRLVCGGCCAPAPMDVCRRLLSRGSARRNSVQRARGRSAGRLGGFGLWACLPDPKRALGAHGVPLFGEVRLRRTALTLEPCGARAGYTPPSADVLVLARCMGHGARDMQGTESGSRFFTGSVLESVACEPQSRPTGARDAGWPECSWVQVA